MDAPLRLGRPVTPVAILADRLAWLSGQLEDVDGLDPLVVSEAREACLLAAGLDRYLTDCTTPESAALANLARRTDQEDWGPTSLEREMLSGHVEGQALKFLVYATKARRVLEIGMFTGYSALAMAEGLPEGGQVVACEENERAAALAQECFAGSAAGRRISVRRGPAYETMVALADARETFDLVFIDADKAGYVHYLDLVLDRALLAPRGVVCVDNTLMQGEPYGSGSPSPNGEAIAHFNHVVAEDPRVEQVMLPLRDGLTLIRRVDG